ncbi:MAG: glycoside hydrolase family 13 protein [Clostridia bacterium]|nr:glycoside hydrolase family 13 protein [Clostridia bacterium]
MRILYDSKSSWYKTPFGTLTPGERCDLALRIPVSCKTLGVSLCINRENGVEYASFSMTRGEISEGYEAFRVSFALPFPGLFFYYFRITTENECFSLYREGFDQTNMEAGDLWQISCIPASFSPPDFYAGRVMYQIFPDRFYREGSVDATGKLGPYRLHASFAELPDYLPDETGEVQNCDFFGGNLAGIREKLPYLHRLGVRVIYLNPIFKAYSNHRYDTADYKKIDELLGTEEDFVRLCDSAHALGMRVILDGVFSHTGSDSLYFDAMERYGNGALYHLDSPYRSWFDFKPDGTYTSWWGIKTLPCVREMDPSYLDYVIDSEDSVIAHWLRLGADGFRLDVADELPDAFILRLRNRLKALKPDALLIGEVWEDASNKCSYSERRRYFTDGELDSVMNYPFRKAILDLVSGRDMGTAFCHTVMDLAENYPPAVLHTLMNMLSTHDTPRVLSYLSPTPPPAEKHLRARFRMSDEDRRIAHLRLRCATALQFMLPGMPCIYYGDEIGTEGWEDPFCRSFFDWSRAEENDLLSFFASLGALREGERTLQRGGLRVEADGRGVVRIERALEGTCILATFNLGDPIAVDVSGTELVSFGKVASDEGTVLSRYGFFVEKRK